MVIKNKKVAVWQSTYYGETLSPTTTPYQCTVDCCLGYKCVPTIESTAPIT